MKSFEEVKICKTWYLSILQSFISKIGNIPNRRSIEDCTSQHPNPLPLPTLDLKSKKVTRLGFDPRTLSVLRIRDNQLHHPARAKQPLSGGVLLDAPVRI